LLGSENCEKRGQTPNHKNGWGRSGNPYNDQWLHSDMKDMAYYYVFRLYDELVQNIQGNAQ